MADANIGAADVNAGVNLQIQESNQLIGGGTTLDNELMGLVANYFNGEGANLIAVGNALTRNGDAAAGFILVHDGNALENQAALLLADETPPSQTPLPPAK